MEQSAFAELEHDSKKRWTRRAEQEDEIDMPGMSDRRLREKFFRPFKFVRREK